jgi:hypothetical protein
VKLANAQNGKQWSDLSSPGADVFLGIASASNIGGIDGEWSLTH